MFDCEGCFFGVSSGDECLWILFQVVVAMEFVLDGEIGFGGCGVHGC